MGHGRRNQQRARALIAVTCEPIVCVENGSRASKLLLRIIGYLFEGTIAIAESFQAASIHGKEKLGTKQSPLNNMDHLMKVQRLIVRCRFFQKVRIKIRNSIIIALLKLAESGKAN